MNAKQIAAWTETVAAFSAPYAASGKTLDESIALGMQDYTKALEKVRDLFNPGREVERDAYVKDFAGHVWESLQKQST